MSTPRPATYTRVSAGAVGADAHVAAYSGAAGTDWQVQVTFDAGTVDAPWSACLHAPAAADLLALLVPVVERLREVAADELLGTEAGL